MRFLADVDGVVTAIRFYKASTNTGTHVANLWTGTGTKLATATFQNETATGWQQVNLPAPVPITAGTVYVASYHTNTGHYSADEGYFLGQAADNPPLHAPASGGSGVNGVYAYGASSFPTDSWNGSNYWVDVVFSATGSVDTSPPTVTAFTVPATTTTLSVAITSFTATDNVGVTGYLVNESPSTPSATAGGWTTAVPSSYTFNGPGAKTLYAWAKDAGGNVSASVSRSVNVTAPAPGTGPEPEGWYAGDIHVHRSCGGSPESISSLRQKMSTNDLAAISLLADMGNGEVENPVTDLPRVSPMDDPISTSERTVHWDTEWHWDATYFQYPHQALGGHIVALGLDSAEQVWEEYTYPIFQWVRQRNGIAGFAHMQYLGDGIPQSLTCCTPIEYPVETALGMSDFISEDVQGGETAIRAYYRLLNTGFRPGLAAGTDYPCNGLDPLGSLLTYVRVAPQTWSYRAWVEGIAAGRTVISRNGHAEFLKLVVNGIAEPGDEVNLPAAGAVPVTVEWTADRGLSGSIELVQNGVVVASRQAAVSNGAPATLTATVDFSKSGWIAARRMGGGEHQVHTGAVFVIVNDLPVRVSRSDAEFYVQWMNTLLAKTAVGGEWASYFPTSRSEARARYSAAKAVFQQIAEESTPSEPPPPPPPADGQTIFTTQTPTVYEVGPPYELGTKFWSESAGRIKAVRVHTHAAEGGTHVVRIWRVQDGTVLAGPYSWNITPGTEGWKTFTLPTPVSIAAGTEYIVSVSNGPDGNYAELIRGFDVPLVNLPLHADVGAGVYTESMGTMPTSTWENTMYFRDVVFEAVP